MTLSLSIVVATVHHALRARGGTPALPSGETRTLAEIDEVCRRLAAGTRQGAFAWEHVSGARDAYHRLRTDHRVFDIYGTAGEAVLDIRTSDGTFVTDHDGPEVESLLSAIQLRYQTP